MRAHQIYYFWLSAEDKPKSTSYKTFSVEKNLVIGLNGQDNSPTIYALNGSPALGGKPFGYCSILQDYNDGPPTMSVYKSFVNEKYRMKGVARALYDKAEEIAQRQGRHMVPATSVSDEAFAFWNKWKPERIAYDGRHWQQHYLGKVVTYQDRQWTIYHPANNTPNGGFGGKLVGGEATTRIPRKVVTDQLGDFYPKG